MKKLTQKEEEIMYNYWENGPMFVKDLLQHYASQKLHYNTLSTMVRALEEKGYLDHEQFGNTYRYFPVVTLAEYRKKLINTLVKKHYSDSYIEVVLQFLKDQKISLKQLKKLVKKAEKEKTGQI